MPIRAHRKLLLALGCAAAAVSGSSCTDSGGRPFQLSSGHVIHVLSRGVVAESPRTWAIRYRTTVPATDRETLDAEAMELWLEAQAEAATSGATRASLWPANLDSHTVHLDEWRPVLYSYHSIEFQFERDASGSWTHVPHPSRVDRPMW